MVGLGEESVTLASQVGFVALAAVIGAIAYPMLIFVAIKLNWKQLGRVLGNHRQDARFYRRWSLLGAVLGTLMLTGILILDAYGIKDPWYGLTLIALCLLAFYPMVGFLKQRERQ